MSKALLIVESPAKAKTIKKYVGSNYDVLASKGHIKDLPKKGGVDMEHGFEESYELLEEKGKAEIIKAIRASAKKVDKVLLATDPDREGEAIAFHLRDIVLDVNPDVEVHRVLFNEITKKGVLAGLDDPRELDANLYEAQRTRRVLDRIGGYPLSSLLWKKLTFGLSAGRVQTPALRIIVDREHEREAFVPQEYWLVDAQLRGKSGVAFAANLVEVDGEKLERIGSRPAATSEAAATKYVTDLRSASYRIREITRKQSSRKAPAPYITSKLQQDASTRLGMAPKRAMSVAQQLYEGIELGKGKGAETVGLITYMRTDSTRVSDDAITECRTYIEATFGKDALPPKPNEFTAKKKANVQDAHEAIRPTSMAHPPDQVAKYLKEPQLKLYRMIWNRFVASQMVPAVYDQTSVDVEAKAGGSVYGLRASGSVLKKAGWREIWLRGASKEEEAESEASETAEADGASEDGVVVAESGTLPVLDDGETLTLVDPPGAQFVHKATEPPPRFNEASMVKKLEEEGIGRPSTYAEIISKVQARDYVEKQGNQLRPSDLGRLVIEKLVEDGFDLADIGFTRKLEESLDAVAEASAKRLDVLAPFHERLQAQIAKANESKDKWWPEPFAIGEECPDCGAQLMQRWGRNGVFIGCEKYPECKYTRNIPKEGEEDSSREPELTDYDCTECGAKMMKRWGRNGFFLGCSSYPTCKSTRPVPLGFKCPKCKVGEIIEIRSRGGKTFYGCTNYNSDEKCDFRSWQKPIGVPCEQCDAKFLVWMGGKKSPTLKCANPTCDFETPFDPDAYEAEQEATRAAEQAARRAAAEAEAEGEKGAKVEAAAGRKAAPATKKKTGS
ncbi:MAG: type I DNA topoisomerase [Myxococcales bacterium]|nr:type I DNA topoisomerase [Myxococcales bacterium]MCB9628117.1 type I DNA topoisomerase [Sandaracinaceae bacterium]